MKTNPTQEFRDKCEAALADIKDLDSFRQTDKMVDYVMTTANWLFTTHLDQHNPSVLISTGGKLTGVYAYLGQKSARARAERDVYEQKADEMKKAIVLEHVKDKQYKVTEANAMASQEMSGMNDLVLQKEAEKNSWEAITNACQTMTMFIQSALRVKEGERYATGRMHDNAG